MIQSQQHDSLSNNYLANRYLGLRHGQSEANVAEIVVSTPATGLDHYGLTALGRQQVNISVNNCPLLDRNIQLFCSDFRRTMETARIVQDITLCSEPRVDSRLRERDFGDWELKSSKIYPEIWQQDAIDPTHRLGNSESALNVRNRLVDLVRCIEAEMQGLTILLVSHADPLQILQTAFLGIDVSLHRSVDAWGTAEIRQFVADKQNEI
ncbi:MAG: histidine phosphatase family protein [Gammaproteobacteria bacterium]|nr:histidine phosphatase family protein [Gammaproteobacteria bacterium]